MPKVKRFFVFFQYSTFALLPVFVLFDSHAATSCDAGYNSNTGALAILNAMTNSEYIAYVSHDTGRMKDYAKLPNIEKNEANLGNWGVYFPSYNGQVYGTSSCNQISGDTAYNNLIYTTEDYTSMNRENMNGSNCWCKMTDFVLPSQSRSNLTTPWVYLETFSGNSEDKAIKNCNHNCAVRCAQKIAFCSSSDSVCVDKFLRAQVFGEYSTCNVRTYNINYELNGGDWIDGTEIPTHYTILYKNVSIPNTVEKENFTFAGWCESNDPKSSTCSANKTIRTGSLYRDMTFYARWQTQISFEPGTNNATGSMNDQNVYYNQTNIQLPPNTFTKAGYEFDGWDCAVDGEPVSIQLQETTNNNVESYMIAKYSYNNSMTCTAQWKPAIYHIYFNGHDGIDIADSWLEEQEPTTFTVESTARIIPNNPTPINNQYQFAGWCNTEADDCNQLIDTDYTIAPGTAGDVYLWAHWKAAEYDITYYMDEASYPDTELTFQEIETLGLPAKYIYGETTYLPALTRQQYTFIGWYEYDSNGMLVYGPIDAIESTDTGAKTLVGKWVYSCDTETDGLYPNVDDAISTGIEDCYAICPTEFSCPEHSINCQYYTDDIDETGKDYYHENILGEMMNPCEIIYDCEEHYTKNNETGTCDADIFTITYHDASTIINAFTSTDYGSYTYLEGLDLPRIEEIEQYYNKPHYTFLGWYDNAELTGDVITEISTTDFGNKDFYSRWEPTTYYIKFMRGDKSGTGSMLYQSVKYENENIQLNKNNFVAPGYEFNGWSCTATYDNGDNYTQTYQDEGVITKYEYNSDMVCTAQWRANRYDLTYDCGNGELVTNQSATVPVYYDGAYILNSSICERPNYTISSWTCTNNLDTTTTTWNITDGSTCTANWAETEYTVTYKEKDGTVLNNLLPNRYLTSNTPLTVPNTTPTKEHYQFAGWCKDLALTDCAEFQTIQSGTSGDITFYAKWIATACPAGQYLDSGKCSNCPTDFISNAWMATNPADCYYDCNTLCPDNATCTFAGITDGLIHYGSGQEISSCSTNMAFECNLGYTKSYAIYNECLPDEYYINYFNTRNSYWGVGSIHPESYTVQNSRIIISDPMRDHYNFDGWCIDEDNCDTPVKSFVIDPTTTLRNMNLYAQWSEKEFVCDSGKFLHIGDDTACLSTIKRTSPALGIGKGNKKYYLNMAHKHNGTAGLNINKESNKQMNVLYNGTLYNVHDDSVVTK